MLNVGAVFDSLNVRDVSKLRIPVPSLVSQAAIANVLDALDEKIDLNRAIWTTRIEFARAVFTRWVSKAEGSVRMSSLFSIGISGVWGNGAPVLGKDNSTQCLRGRDIEDYVQGKPQSAPTRFVSTKDLERRTAQTGQLWTAGSGSLGPTLLITDSVRQRWSRPVTFSNFVKCIDPLTGDLSAAAVAWHVMMSLWTSGRFANYQTGTAMPNLDAKGLLADLSLPLLPSRGKADVLESTLLALNSGLLTENDALVESRDTLLPELLSGRLRANLPDAAAAALLS